MELSANGPKTATLSALAAETVRGYVTPEEGAELGRRVAADYPDAVDYLRQIAAWAAGESVRPLDAIEGFRARYHGGAEAAHWRRRGRGLLVLAELTAMTGERHWAEAAAGLLAELPAPPELPAGDSDLPVLPWHPGCPAGLDALSVAHVLQNLAVALPLLWEAWDQTSRAWAIGYMARWADVLHRGLRNDPAFNIPLHGRVAAAGAGLLFPDLPGARRWVEHAERMLGPGGPYAGRPFVTPDGYTGEGFSYQNVNGMLLARIFALLDRCRSGGAPETLRDNLEKLLEFDAASLRPDGSRFLVGDTSGWSPHEPEIEPSHLLHLGAALLDRSDFKSRAGNVTETQPRSMLFFLMGLDGYARWRAMPAPDLGRRAHLPAAFPEAGFFHLKAGRGRPPNRDESRFGASVGGSLHAMLAAGLSHNHAHHDCLSVMLFAAGRELLADPGGRDAEAGRHGVCRLGHLSPAGPRHEKRRLTCARFAASPCGRLQLALAEHDLYEAHRQRRALLLCLPRGPEDAHGFCIVWDRIASTDTPGGAEEGFAPLRVVETIWPLHSPGGPARTEGLAGWSCHLPSARPRGLGAAGEFAFTCAEAHQAARQADSEGNLQVSALVPRAPATVALKAEQGLCHHFGRAAATPVLRFDWRGRLPHEMAYVLAPFVGVAEGPPRQVDGWCADPNAPGSLRASMPDGQVVVSAEGLAGGRSPSGDASPLGASGRIRVEMTSAWGAPCVLEASDM